MTVLQHLTADGCQVTVGGILWHERGDLVRITETAIGASGDGTVWHRFISLEGRNGGMADASRLYYKHPVTGQPAAA